MHAPNAVRKITNQTLQKKHMAGTAVAFALWDASKPQVGSRATASVLHAWVKKNYLARVVHVHIARGEYSRAVLQRAMEAEASAMGPQTPVIVVSMANTVLLCTDWDQWTTAWMKANKWLWCNGWTAWGTASSLRRTLYRRMVLQWHDTHKLPEHQQPPAWGVLGGVAQAVLTRLTSPFMGKHRDCSVEVAIADAWRRGDVFVDAVPTLVWVWTPVHPRAPLPTAAAISGVHQRLQRILPSLLQAPDQGVVAYDALQWTISANPWLKGVALCVGGMLAFVVLMVVLSRRRR